MIKAPKILITPEQLEQAMREKLARLEITRETVGCVAGPGRSGAIAAVYASHMLGVPFVPVDRPCPPHLQPILIIDTATSTGRTLRKAARKHGPTAQAVAIFHEPPRVLFWYEAEAMGNRAPAQDGKWWGEWPAADRQVRHEDAATREGWHLSDAPPEVITQHMPPRRIFVNAVIREATPGFPFGEFRESEMMPDGSMKTIRSTSLKDIRA